ncbi:hypothetical protein [Mycolicibacterium komossense]|uniref:Bacteriophage protein n=1 Tax=Mycolicibacterium komossense TaxID=1779 RepID=A0ABT3CMI3_9MYCO|nr:hypothetical protein [Mycolicibacterium komossense]MCV7230650.1 hypothetical protein [Mycolicibacterium komossense]
MADYDALTYCKLIGLFNGIVGDTTGLFGDDDTRPDLYNVNMQGVVGISIGKTVSPQLRLPGVNPPRTILLAPTDVNVESGVLRLPGQVSSVDGVEVIAKSSVMGLGDTPLVCTVKFAPTTINGTRFQFDTVSFALPTIEPADYAAGRVQFITIRGSAGVWRVAYDSVPIGTNLAYNANGASVQTALRGIAAIGNNVTVSNPVSDGAGNQTYMVTFTGPLAAGNPSPLTPTQVNVSGGTLPGVKVTDQYAPFTVDLSTVERIDTPPTVSDDLVVRLIPDDWNFDDNGLLHFTAGGVPVGTGKAIPFADIVGDAVTLIVGNYADETVYVFDRMTVRPDFDRRKAIDSFIKTLKDYDLWDRLDALNVLAAHTMQAGLLNWRRDTANMLAINSPIFTPDIGFTGDGVGAHLTNSSAETVHTQIANQAVSMRLVTPGTAGGWDLWWTAGWSAAFGIRASSVDWHTAKPGIVNTPIGATSRPGLYTMTQVAADQSFLYKEGGQIGSDTTAVPDTGAPNNALPLKLLTSSGTTGFSNATIALCAYGAGMSAAETALFYRAEFDYMTALGVA